ncbi:unnamed protein product, partial [marine sediment metagenome]
EERIEKLRASNRSFETSEEEEHKKLKSLHLDFE